MKVAAIILCLFAVSLCKAEDPQKTAKVAVAAGHHDQSSSSSESFEKYEHRSHHHHKGSHGDSHSKSDEKYEHHHHHHHHEHSDRVCSIQSDYWLPGIHEKRVCRNTAASSTEDCTNCCVEAYLENHNYKNERGYAATVRGFIATDPKNNHHRQCVCCSPKHHNCSPKLKPLTTTELNAYMAAYDGTPGAGPAIKFNNVEFLPTVNGFVVTCQCEKHSGDECWLEFDNGVDSFITKNATGAYNSKKADGSFDMVSSTLVTCQNGLNVYNGTTVTHYTCYAFTYLVKP